MTVLLLEILTCDWFIQVNGQNVVGVRDKEITKYIEEGGPIITITIIPSYIFNHIMKK